MVLSIRDAVAGYGATQVLQGATLSIEPASRTALLGANGAGKSTLLLALAGALRLQQGSVELDHRTLQWHRDRLRAHRRRVQLVVQDPDDQLLSADVSQDVSFAPLNAGLPESEVRIRVADAMEVFGITHLADRPTHKLSYGERRRVTCAGAVALQPDYLLLDEPTAGLDANGLAGLVDALERLHTRGTAVLIATHDVGFATAWAQRLVTLSSGTIRATPPPAPPSPTTPPSLHLDPWGAVPGLPDEAYDDDGLITKRHVRASALAHLRPRPGGLLWDVGAGAGSIAIEWCRAAADCRALAVERDPERAERARRNAARLAPARVEVCVDEAHRAVEQWRCGPAPDAVFIGGGCSPDLIDTCLDALPPGGTLVAHGVTVETELMLIDSQQRHGGDLARISVEHLEPLASWRGWRPARTILAWSVTR